MTRLTIEIIIKHFRVVFLAILPLFELENAKHFLKELMVKNELFTQVTFIWLPTQALRIFMPNQDPIEQKIKTLTLSKRTVELLVTSRHRRNNTINL